MSGLARKQEIEPLRIDQAASFAAVGPLTSPGQLAVSMTAPIGVNLSEADRAVAERRFAVIEALVSPKKHRLIWLQCGERRSKVVRFLAGQHKTAERTIYRWLKAWEEGGGLPALVDKDRSDKGRPRAMNAAAMDFLLAASTPRHKCYGQLSVREVFRAYREESSWRAAHAGKKLGDFELRKYAGYVDPEGRLLQKAQLPEASYRTFLRWYTKIPEVVRVLGRKGNEAFQNTQEIISWRDLSAIQPMDFVVLDHRVLDIFAIVQAGDSWRLVRPWITAAIDMRCRRWLSFVIVETPSSDSIATVLKKTFILHGLPRAVYVDNGRDFRCHYIEGKRDLHRQASAVGELKDGWPGILESLGIRVHHAIIKRARSKIIEPVFRALAEFDRSLPHWCGNKPTARPERFQRLLDHHECWLRGDVADAAFPTIEQVAGDYRDQIEMLNEREREGAPDLRKITATGYGYMSANEAFEKLTANVPRRAVPDAVLQFAFRKRRELIVKHGEVRATFDGRPFHYRLAESEFRLMALNGQRITIAYDVNDLEEVAIYHENRLVGIAHCAELRKMGESGFIEDERNRRKARRETRSFIEAVHRQVHIPDHRERADRRREVTPSRAEPQRPSIAAPVSKALEDAAREAARLHEFSFAASPADGAAVIRAAEASAYADDDSEFNFFSKDGE